MGVSGEKRITAAIGQRVIAFFLDHRRTLRFYKRNIIMNAAAGLYRRDRREQQKEGDGNRPATAKNRIRQTTTSLFFVLKFVRFKVQSKNIGNISFWLILSKHSTDYILYYILYCIPV